MIAKTDIIEKYFPDIGPEPAIREVKCNASPEELFGLFEASRNSALLNSSFKSDSGRFSFIGIDPFLIIKSENHKITILAGGNITSIPMDPFDLLRIILRKYRLNNPGNLPFTAGGIGYLSYDLKNLIEKLPRKAEDDINLPELYFAFYETLLIFDNNRPGTLYISTLNTGQNPINAKKRTQDLIDMIKGHTSTGLNSPALPGHNPILESNMSRTEYINSVKKIIEHLKAGDIYQACLAQRFKTKWPFAPYALYRKLNEMSPSPFSAYLNFDEAKILSSSPELLIRHRDDILETRPMKGTRPRGNNKEEDIELMDQLMKSEKEKAELSMIVDLERNDLGKVSVPGTIELSEHRRIETYSTVFQTISVVKSKVDKKKDAIDILKSLFPGGSISGCPKIRAMEIIDDLEPNSRSVYTGSIGYMSFHNTMDLNVAIRTMILKNDNVYFHVGSGIVIDSDPEKEYTETLDKAKAMIKSLGA